MELRRYDILYKNEADFWWFKGRRILLERILKNLPNKSSLKILDTGSCTGYNLHLLNKYGKAYGVDVEKKAIEYCKKRRFKRMHLLKNGMQLPFKSNSFDVITCLDVLEHIEKDEKYLQELNRVLRSKGILIIFVPAIKLLWSQLDVKSHHQTRYTISMLKNKIRKTRFLIKEIKYFNYILFWPMLPFRLIQKLPFFKKNEFGSELIVNNKLINQLLYYIFVFDVWSTKWFSPPIGVSIFFVAEKG
ncbi:methyltransferase domain-containing protein [Patescibacteria group bacterium]|nr:methyltransferase domain-containing protein [Patescibacteria group bacterium]